MKDKHTFKKIECEQPFLAKPNVQIRWIPRPIDADYIILDEKEVYVSVNPEEGGIEKIRSFWTNSLPIIKLLQNNYEALWDMGMEIP
jgi:hypothetical protein